MKMIETRNGIINSGFMRRKGHGSGIWFVCAILKETEKALNVVTYSFPDHVKALWVPKACLVESPEESEIMTDCTFQEAVSYGWDCIRFWS